MARYTIEPTREGAYDVTVRRQDGTERFVRRLASMQAALEWISSQNDVDDPKEAEGERDQ